MSLEDKQNIVVQKLSLSNTFIQQQKGELADLQRQQAQLSDKLGPNHPTDYYQKDARGAGL